MADKKPTKSWRVGNLSVSQWDSVVNGPNGTYNNRSFSINKSWRDKDGTWKNTNFLNLIDLIAVQAMLKKAIPEQITVADQLNQSTTIKQGNQSSMGQRPPEADLSVPSTSTEDDSPF